MGSGQGSRRVRNLRAVGRREQEFGHRGSLSGEHAVVFSVHAVVVRCVEWLARLHLPQVVVVELAEHDQHQGLHVWGTSDVRKVNTPYLLDYKTGLFSSRLIKVKLSNYHLISCRYQ